MMNKRRALAYFMAVFVLVSSSFYPQREAKAFVPAIPIVMALVNAAGAVLASDALTAAGMYMLGGMAVAAIFSIPGDSSSVAVAVPLTSDPAKTAVAMPAPAAPPTSPPSGSGSVNCGSFYSLNPYITTAEVCGITNAASACPGTYINGRCAVGDVMYDNFTSRTINQTTCPDGYVLSGSDCVLSNPRKAVPDKRVDLYPCPSGLCFDPAKDKDVKPVNTEVGSPSCNGCGKVWGVNSKGEPFVTTITPRADGGSDIRTETQVQSASGSAIRTDTMTTTSAGTVSAAGSTVAAGSMSGAGVDGVAPTVATTSPTSTTQPIVFPTDYARAGEAAAASVPISSRLDKLHDDLTKTSAPPVDPVVPVAAQFNAAFFSGTFNNLLGWQLPAHTSICPTGAINFDYFGQAFRLNMDAQCTILLMDSVSSVAAVSFNVLWVVAALFIVLGA
jgi:hypothetical protein